MVYGKIYKLIMGELTMEPIKLEMEMTEKQLKKESAMMAASIGSMQMLPWTTLNT